jgi:hypothetical protein
VRWRGSDARNRWRGAAALAAVEEAEMSSSGRQEVRDRAPNHKLGLHVSFTERAWSKMWEAFGASVEESF